MKLSDVRRKASAMPLVNPAYPPGPYRFYNREYLVIAYRTDLDALRAVVPEPLEVVDPIVKYEFIRMPDSTGFGDYTETGQVIPVHFMGSDGAMQEGGMASFKGKVSPEELESIRAYLIERANQAKAAVAAGSTRP